jgi:hypothetical protein
LIEGWYDFNDSTVSPILPGKLQSQFGNASSENAYILVYRQKKMCSELVANKQQPEIPQYFKNYIEEMNKLNQE